VMESLSDNLLPVNLYSFEGRDIDWRYLQGKWMQCGCGTRTYIYALSTATSAHTAIDCGELGIPSALPYTSHRSAD